MNKVNSIRNYLYSGIEQSCSKSPEKPAIIHSEDETASFDDVKRIYDSFISFAHENDIQGYERFLIWTDDVLSFVLIEMPLLESGVIAHIDEGASIEKAKSMIEFLHHDFIITDNTDSEMCRAARANGLGIIKFNRTGKTGSLLIDFVMEKKPDDKPRGRRLKNESQILTGTTSGTTSEPKIVTITHENFLGGIRANIKTYGIDENDIFLIVTPVRRNICLNAITGAMVTGATVVVGGGFNHKQFMEYFKTYDITTFASTPAVLDSIIEYAGSEAELAVNKLKYIRVTGAPMTNKLRTRIERIFNTTAVSTYGMTETKALTSTYNAPAGYKEGSVGVSIGTSIKINNGEILVKGKTVFPGYENEDIDNNEYFTDGWFHTGDAGYLDEDGYLFITGRIKEMINRGGEKISPYEVEKVILQHQDIRSAAVFPYPDDGGSENAGVVVVLEKGKAVELGELRRFLSGYLAPYKMPTLLYCTDEIPVGENGKVKRKSLFEILNKRYPEIYGLIEKETKVVANNTSETIVMQIWKKYLRKRNIQPDDEFTVLGGDSLNGAAVLSAIYDKTGVSVPVNILFENGTVRSISEYIELNKSSLYKSKFLVLLQTGGSGKPIIFVHPAKGDSTTYRQLGKSFAGIRPVYAIAYRKDVRFSHPLNFDKLANAYADELMAFDPVGPYYLSGHCWGGVLAYKIACIITARGGKIGMLSMLDSASKDDRRLKNGKSTGLAGRFNHAFADSIEQLKQYKFTKRLKLIIKKAANIFNLVILVESRKVYAFGIKRKSSILMNLAGKTGALGYAYQKYKPEKYTGKIHYFKSKLGKSGKRKDYEYWAELAENLELIQMSSSHNDLVTGENAKKLVVELEKIMGIH